MINKIACLVVTHNRIDLLKTCLNSIKNQTRKFDSIYVVNCGSTDNTKEWLSKQNKLTIYNIENVGGAGGFNYGLNSIDLSQYKWIFLTDDDVILNTKTLEKLLVFLHNNDKLDIAAVQPLKKTIDKKFGIIHGTISWNIQNLSYKLLGEEALRKGFVQGENFSFEGVLISSCIIQRIGLPIKEYFIGFDDIEYSIRLKRQYPEKKIIILGEVLLVNSKSKMIKNKSIFNRNFYVPIGFEIEKLKYYYRNQIFTFRLYNAPIRKIHRMFLLFYREYTFWNIIKIFFFGKNRLKSLKTIILEGFVKGFTGDITLLNHYTSAKDYEKEC